MPLPAKNHPSGLLALAAAWGLLAGAPLEAQVQIPPGIGEAGLAPGFILHVVNAESTFCACAVDDVNGDGLPDIVSGSHWYEAPDWKPHAVRTIERIRGRFDGYAHLPLDVDGDGDRDLITVNYRSASIQWFEHPADLATEWPRHYIALPGPMETGRLHDIDGDGLPDILPNGVKAAAWWRAEPAGQGPHGPRLNFAEQKLPVEVAGHGVGVGDVNGDGRGDILAPKGWLEAPEAPLQKPWTWHPEWDLGRASIPILARDVDGDGDSDILWSNAHDYGIFWLEQRPQPGGQRQWVRHEIDRRWSQAHALLWGDLDGDGQGELIAGKRFMAHDGRDPGETDPLVIYRYQFDPAKKEWIRHPISEHGIAGFGLDPKLVDLDRDGDLDLVCPGRTGLYWIENHLSAKP